MGHYGVPMQYERSFKWKVGHFRTLCSVSGWVWSGNRWVWSCDGWVWQVKGGASCIILSNAEQCNGPTHQGVLRQRHHI